MEMVTPHSFQGQEPSYGSQSQSKRIPYGMNSLLAELTPGSFVPIVKFWSTRPGSPLNLDFSLEPFDPEET